MSWTVVSRFEKSDTSVFACLEPWCFVVTEYQLLYDTEISAFDRCAELLVAQHCVFSSLISYGTKNVWGIYNVLH